MELIDPFSGYPVDCVNVNALAEAYDRAQDMERQLAGFRFLLAGHLAAMTTGEARTRRLRTDRHRIRIEMPDDSWDQKALKELWTDYPQSALYLRVARVEPKLREVKKLANETGAKQFEAFKAKLLSANQGPRGAPRIYLEE